MSATSAAAIVPTTAQPAAPAKPAQSPKQITHTQDSDGDHDGSTGASKPTSPAASSPFGPAVKVTLSPQATALLAATAGGAPQVNSTGK